MKEESRLAVGEIRANKNAGAEIPGTGEIG
jgi:hypothetical protein